MTWQMDFEQGEIERWSLEPADHITLSATRPGRLQPWTVAIEDNFGRTLHSEKIRMPDGSPAILPFERLYAQQKAVTMLTNWANGLVLGAERAWPAATRLATAIADHLYRAHVITDAVWLAQDAIQASLDGEGEVDRRVAIAQFLFNSGYIENDTLIGPATEIIGRYIDGEGESRV